MSTTHALTIDDDRFPLADEEIDRVRDEILAAARSGGAFVAFDVNDNHRVEVLVGASSCVRIDHRERPTSLELVSTVEEPVSDWMDEI